jgi:SNF2 family DNA or RNA helicase
LKEFKSVPDPLEEDATPKVELIGDTTFSKILYQRMLCGQYSQSKLEAFKDLVESTNDRLIVFYNFNEEMAQLAKICSEMNKPMAFINGHCKDLTIYEQYDNSITFVQYQAGAMGLNLQKANKIVYFTLPLMSELFEQSKKRIHRIGQENPCFYYMMICKGSIEENIFQALEMRKDFTDELFRG